MKKLCIVLFPKLLLTFHKIHFDFCGTIQLRHKFTARPNLVSIIKLVINSPFLEKWEDLNFVVWIALSPQWPRIWSIFRTKPAGTVASTFTETLKQKYAFFNVITVLLWWTTLPQRIYSPRNYTIGVNNLSALFGYWNDNE